MTGCGIQSGSPASLGYSRGHCGPSGEGRRQGRDLPTCAVRPARWRNSSGREVSGPLLISAGSLCTAWGLGGVGASVGSSNVGRTRLMTSGRAERRGRHLRVAISTYVVQSARRERGEGTRGACAEWGGSLEQVGGRNRGRRVCTCQGQGHPRAAVCVGTGPRQTPERKWASPRKPVLWDPDSDRAPGLDSKCCRVVSGRGPWSS